MRALPRLAQLYIAMIAVVGVGVALLQAPRLPSDVDGALSLTFFTLAACSAQVFQFYLPRVHGAVLSIATACLVAVAVLFGPAAAAWSALISTATSALFLKRPLSRIIFNSCQLSLAFGAAAFAYHTIWNGLPLANLARAVPAAIALEVVYFLLNTGFVFFIVSVVDHVPFLRLWRQSARRILIHDVIMIAAGLVFAVLWIYNRWSIPLMFPLILMLYQSMSAVGKMEQQTKDALLVLADVIDRRDPWTAAHSERVAVYVGWICEQMRLPADETEIIIYAARLHDLGKVGVPDGLLLKPGKLTMEEEALFRMHPDVGADIISKFPIFREGTSIVRTEHEWFDGRGYPQALQGDAIPLGARIIAVADAYEAMTSDRPYRKALLAGEAFQRLKKASGTQFDPAVVDAFLAATATRQNIYALEHSRAFDGSARPSSVAGRPEKTEAQA